MSAGHDHLLSVSDLTKTYRNRGGLFSKGSDFHAVKDVGFHVGRNETLGLVGESGSGKSTIGRMVMGLTAPTAGHVIFDGEDVTSLPASRVKDVRRKMQMVFQDPYSALSPRMRVGQFVAEPMVVHGIGDSEADRREQVVGLFRRVGLNPDFMERYPHEFSGGQRQRICIARALALGPKFIVADEPITALDVSIQAQIVNLFQDLQQEMQMSYLFIAHDLSMVRYLCQRVAVMLRGRLVEIGPTAAIFGDPQHPYTQSLLSAVPIANPRLERARKRIAYQYSPETLGDQLEEVSSGHFVLK
jgi:peptide/nickel transport system ATP-binding protein